MNRALSVLWGCRPNPDRESADVAGILWAAAALLCFTLTVAAWSAKPPPAGYLHWGACGSACRVGCPSLARPQSPP